MKIIVTGGTGMVGAEVVREAILDREIETVTAIVRKPLEIQHTKLKTVIHKDFMDYSALTDIFKEHDACLWCLGISQSQVSKEEYFVITYDYTIAAAKSIQAANSEMTFLFLSGAGADSTEKSRVIFARVKGKAENALMKMGIKMLFIARPAGIKPIHKNKNAPLVAKLMIPLYPLFEIITPKLVITSVELARAMLQLAKHGGDKVIYENAELKRMGRAAVSIEPFQK